MRRERWRTGLLLREAIANCGARGGRLRALLVLAVVGGIVFVGYSAAQGRQLADTALQRAQDGSQVVSFIAADSARPAVIDRQSCEALADDPRVERSGVLAAPRMVDIDQLGRRQRVISASVGLFPQLGQVDALLGGLMPEVSGRLIVEGVPLTVGRAKPQPPGIETNSSVVAPVSWDRSTFDECIVVLGDLVVARDTVTELAARLDVEGGPLASNSVGMRAADVAAAYESRPDRWLGVLLGVFGGLAAGVVAAFRAEEIAVYRLSGSSAGDVARLLFLEQLVVAGIYGASVAGMAVLLADHLVAPIAVVAWGAAASCAWVVVASIASLPVVLRNPVTRSRRA